MRLVALSFCFLVAVSASAFAQSGAGIAAIINDDVITNSDVESRVNLAVFGAHTQPSPEIRKQLMQQSLNALIEEQIRLSEAKRLNMTADDKEIEEGFATLAAQNNMPVEKFVQILKQNPAAYNSMKRQIMTQVVWGKVVKSKLRPQVNVGDTDIDAYIADQAKHTGKVEYEVAEIYLPFTDATSESQALKLAQDIITEMQTKKTRFSVLAKQYSQGAEASKGGLLGWVSEGRLDKNLENALKPMQPGQLSAPVKSANAYHVLFMKDRRQILSMEESNRKIQIKQLFIPAPPQAPPQYVQQAFGQIKTWQSQATDCVTMQKIINANPSPLSRDLGMVLLSTLPPPVMEAVKQAPTGKALEPLRAADGFLLMMVCGRQDAVDPEAIRDAAANAIGSERLNRLQRRYFRDLKDAAYIDIKMKS